MGGVVRPFCVERSNNEPLRVFDYAARVNSAPNARPSAPRGLPRLRGFLTRWTRCAMAGQSSPVTTNPAVTGMAGFGAGLAKGVVYQSDGPSRSGAWAVSQ
jgi:hypothetical protein